MRLCSKGNNWPGTRWKPRVESWFFDVLGRYTQYSLLVKLTFRLGISISFILINNKKSRALGGIGPYRLWNTMSQPS